jgi:hypothetical protein
MRRQWLSLLSTLFPSHNEFINEEKENKNGKSEKKTGKCPESGQY